MAQRSVLKRGAKEVPQGLRLSRLVDMSINGSPTKNAKDLKPPPSSQQSWDSEKLLQEPSESFPPVVSPKILADCLGGYRRCFTNEALAEVVCACCSERVFKHVAVRMPLTDFLNVFETYLEPKDEFVKNIVSEHFSTEWSIGDEVYRVPVWFFEKFSAQVPSVSLRRIAKAMSKILVEELGFVIPTPGNLFCDVCMVCLKSVKAGKVPEFALANDCWVGEVPAVLQGLTVIEQFLISLVAVHGAVIALRGSGPIDCRQHGAKGNFITLPLDPTSTQGALDLADGTVQLPRTEAELMQTILVQYYGRRFGSDKVVIGKLLKVRRVRVGEAIAWLLANNREYSSARLVEERLAALPEDAVPPSFLQENLQLIDDRDVLLNESQNGDRQSYTGDEGKETSEGEDVVLESSGFLDAAGSSVESNLMKESAIRNSYLRVGMGATGMNEFSAFGRILGGGFPLLFPYGVGTPKESGDVKKHTKHLMAFSDRRFAQHRVFPFYICNTLQRHSCLRNAHFALNHTSPTAVVDGIAAVTGEMLETVGKALRMGLTVTQALAQVPFGVTQLFNKLKVVGRNVPGSSLSKGAQLRVLFAMMQSFGPAHLFITINPNDWSNPVLMKLATGSGCLDVQVPEWMLELECFRIVASNPGPAAVTFDLIIRAFLSELVRCGNPEGGIFGPVDAYAVASEGQERGTLHGHLILWLRGGGNSEGFYRAYAQRDGFKDRFLSYFGGISRSSFGATSSVAECQCKAGDDAVHVSDGCSCQVCLPTRCVVAHGPLAENVSADVGSGVAAADAASILGNNDDADDTEGTSESKAEPVTVGRRRRVATVNVMSERPPNLTLGVDATPEQVLHFLVRLKEEADRVAVLSQIHKHTFTCFKNGKQVCRFSFPKQLHDVSHLVDETLALVGRRDCKWVNSFNEMLSVALRCNNDIKYLLSTLDCKNIMIYVAAYISKKQLTTHAMFSFLRAAYDDRQVAIRSEPPAGAATCAKKLVTRCVMKFIGNEEMQAPTVMQLLKGFLTFYVSHTPITVPLGNAMSLAKSSRNPDLQDKILMNAVVDYMHRPLHPTWYSMCFLDFCMVRQRVKIDNRMKGSEILAYGAVECESKRSVGRKKKRGRPSAMRYRFHPNHPKYDTHCLTFTSDVGKVPKLVGPSIPRRDVTDELYCLCVFMLVVRWSALTFDMLEGNWCEVYKTHVDDSGLLCGIPPDGVEPCEAAGSGVPSEGFGSGDGGDGEGNVQEEDGNVSEEIDSDDVSSSDGSDEEKEGDVGAAGDEPVVDAPTERVASYVRKPNIGAVLLGLFVGVQRHMPLVVSDPVYVEAKRMLGEKCKPSPATLNMLNNIELMHTNDLSRSADMAARSAREKIVKRTGCTRTTVDMSDPELQYNADGLLTLNLAIDAAEDKRPNARVQAMLNYVQDGAAAVPSRSIVSSTVIPWSGRSSIGIVIETAEDFVLKDIAVAKLVELKSSAVHMSNERTTASVRPVSVIGSRRVNGVHLQSRSGPSAVIVRSLSSPMQYAAEHGMSDDQRCMFVSYVEHAEKVVSLYESNLREQIVSQNWILTGQGGSGKTFVIRHIVDYFEQRGWRMYLRVTATTGAAASNLERKASTIDTLMGFRRDGEDHEWFVGLEGVLFVIIDEYSMLGQEKLCKVLRKMKQGSGSDNPTGLISAVFAGDPLQFAPVADTSLARPVGDLLRRTGSANEASTSRFISRTFWEAISNVVVLKTNRRADGCPLLCGMLSRMRGDGLTEADCATLRSKVPFPRAWLQAPLNSPATAMFVGRNKLRMAIAEKLVDNDAFVSGNKKVIRFLAIDTVHKHRELLLPVATSAFLHKNEKSQLCNNMDPSGAFFVGQQVVMLENQATELGVVNGARGTIVKIIMPDGFDIDEVSAAVRCPMPTMLHVKFDDLHHVLVPGLDEGVLPIAPHTGTCKYYFDAMKTPFVWERTAFPLIPARPVTDYKAQGLGFQYTVCDFVRPPGGKDHTLHVYVMLSRCTTLAGVSVLRNFDSKDIKGRLPVEMLKELARLEDASKEFLARFLSSHMTA